MLICSIYLCAAGFRHFEVLGRKLVQMFKLCSELLAHHSHYNYSLRNMKYTLRKAKELKRSSMSMNEEQIMLKSLRDLILPTLADKDTAVFQMICNDLFSGIDLPDTADQFMRELLQKQLEQRDLQASSWLTDKIMQIYDMLQLRTGIMLIGDSMTGKTTAWQMLAETLKELKNNKNTDLTEWEVFYRTINPKSIRIDQLYGRFDPVSHEWIDGVAGKTFRDMVSMSQDMRTWLIFDGPVDPVWIENLHTLLDENGKFCLSSGEMIERKKLMSVIIETTDLEQTSPASVARCGVVYMQRHQLDWKMLNSSFLIELRDFGLNEIYMSLYEHLVNWLIPAVLEILRNCNTVLNISPTNQYRVGFWSFIFTKIN